MAGRDAQMANDPARATGADRAAAAALFFAVLVPIIGFAFGWDLALYALEVIGILGAIGILVWNLGRGLPRMGSAALYVALTGLAMGLVFSWDQALVVVLVAIAAVVLSRWTRSSRPRA